MDFLINLKKLFAKNLSFLTGERLRWTMESLSRESWESYMCEKWRLGISGYSEVGRTGL